MTIPQQPQPGDPPIPADPRLQTRRARWNPTDPAGSPAGIARATAGNLIRLGRSLRFGDESAVGSDDDGQPQARVSWPPPSCGFF